MRLLSARPTLAFVIAVFLAVAGAAPASACSCARLTLAEQADAATLVAAVTVLRVEDASEAQKVYVVTPTALWKGRPSGEYRVVSAGSGASCGLEGVGVGSNLILFATETDAARQAATGARFTANLCGGTRPHDSGSHAAVVAVLGEASVLSPPIAVATPTASGTAPTALPTPDISTVGTTAPGTPDVGPVVVAVVAGVALVGVLTLVVVARRRRP